MSKTFKQLKQLKNNSKNFLKKCLTLKKSCDKINESLAKAAQQQPDFTRLQRNLRFRLWTLIIKQWNNPENSMNFHSKRTKRIKIRLTLETVKTSKDVRNEPLLFRKQKARVVLRGNKHFNMRVWSWLRMNAGGVLNTCKSNEAPWNASSDKWIGDLVADVWVTRG